MKLTSREFRKKRSRMIAILSVCLIAVVFIFMRALHFQVFQDDRLLTLAKKQFQGRVLIRPRRGMIVDRNLEPLAISVEVQSLAANPKKIELSKISIKKLSKYLGVRQKKIKKLLKKNRSFVWIQRQISGKKIQLISNSGIVQPNGQLRKGFWLVKESKRIYPNGYVAGQILGQTNIDLVGVDGLEYQYNEYLKGKITSMKAIRDGLRRPTFIDAGEVKHIEDGKVLRLTLDAALQFEVERILSEYVKKTRSKSGSVLIMDSLSGEIFVMANVPFFDPNKKSGNINFRRNRLLTDGYEPGSTLKPILVASVLESGKKINDIIWGGMGRTKIQGHWISEAETKEKFGWMSYEKLIQVSSNVGAAHLALNHGQKKYLKTLRRLGFGKKTNIEFPGEISGWLPRKKILSQITLANIGFGQGIMATRIQMARVYASFLNGGWLVEPTLIVGEKIQQKNPTRIWSTHTAQSIVQALRKVTQKGGTGTAAVLSGFEVAGKTGTAQTVDPKTKTYSRSRYISSFIGFPLNVDPKIVILATLDYPKGNYYASKTTAPLFKAVLEAAVNRFGMQAKPALVQIEKDHIRGTSAMRNLKAFLKASSSDVSLAKRQFEIYQSGNSSSRTWKMPSLIGLTPREVARALKGFNFDLKIKGFGMVKKQTPKSGKKVSEGTSIMVELSLKD